jgi:hypothetical protein
MHRDAQGENENLYIVRIDVESLVAVVNRFLVLPFLKIALSDVEVARKLHFGLRFGFLFFRE